MVPLQVSAWPWYYVAVYFFFGGIAAGSYLLAALTLVFGTPTRDKPLMHWATYLAAVLILVCPVLLSLDLGRGLRFWRMLTRFKLLSPVSLGSWALLTFGFFAVLSSLIFLAEEGKWKIGASILTRLPHGILMRIGAFFGIFVAGYTGVLLSSTVIPFWNSNQLLGLTFLVSALSTALAAVTLLLLWRGYHQVADNRRFQSLELILLAFEILLVVWMVFQEGGDILLTSQFLLTFVLAVAVFGVLVPIVMLLVYRERAMPASLLAVTSILILIGGFFLRYSVLEAGKASVGGADQAVMLLRLLTG
ncbi:MAG TPA: NrfD/PsrC family molybdoenzyme membrane anchor subunit [Candidatus Binatia bacterium]|jgi:formate-dependent nitrite reductase membrane component NrfD|nr:NrfD/PsrC family molybdoenzyme membrane anchor subunit [Candidatus Binatia bacterium]